LLEATLEEEKATDGIVGFGRSVINMEAEEGSFQATA
jgi:hypothetical protein